MATTDKQALEVTPAAVPDSENITVKMVQNVALTDALVRQKPKLFTKNMFMLYGCLLIGTMNSCINGYDGSLMGSINSYEQYRSYFGFPLDSGTPSTGIVYAIYTIGSLLGSFAAGPASDFRGRRVGMFIGSFIIIVGTCIQATAHSLGQFMAGRFILGFGVSIITSAGPSYVAEMAHPAYRGAMTGIYTTFWFVGGIPGTFVPYGTSTISGNNSWRIPTWVQMTFAGIVLVVSLFLPESPRWLMAHDRQEEAIQVMAKYHGEGDPNSPIVQLELQEMRDEISLTGSDKRWWDYRDLFKSPDLRYRTLLVTAMAIFGQWGGNGPVSYYYPQMLQGAGITDNHYSLFLQGMQSVVSFAGGIIGTICTDKIGRRQQLIGSTLAVIAIFCIIIGINATNLTTDSTGAVVAKNSGGAKAEIAFVFIFGFVYAFGWTPMQALYSVECLKFESRAKGMGWYSFWTNIAGFYNTFVTGIAFTGAGWKYYFLFIFWDLFEVVFMYFFFVETQKYTLEELDYIFKGRNRVKRSLNKHEVIIHENEGVTEVLDKETVA